MERPSRLNGKILVTVAIGVGANAQTPRAEISKNITEHRIT